MLSKAPRYRGLGADPETVLAPTVTSVPKVPPMKSTPNWKTAAQAAPPVQAVLPSLDESGVELSTVNGLFSGARSTGRDDEATTRLKGDPRMARVIAHAVADRERPLRRTVEGPWGPRVLRIAPGLSGQVVSAAKRRPGTHNSRRRAVEALLWRHLLDQAAPPAGGRFGALLASVARPI